MSEMVRDWTFEPSRKGPVYAARHVWRRLAAQKPPEWKCLLAPGPAPRWQVYFVYVPAAECSAAHLFTLERLKSSDTPLLIVCAAPSPEAIPEAVRSHADALYWKSLDGFDFSGYAVALHAIAQHSPGADVFVLNDSVFGPFHPLDPFHDRARWDLTGFTADAGGENHIQSYAFILKDVTPQRMERLDPVFSLKRSWNRGIDVVICQELRLARVAAESMTVGSFLYSPSTTDDPTLLSPGELLDMGHPFLKKSLTTRHLWAENSAFVEDYLARVGHPPIVPQDQG